MKKLINSPEGVVTDALAGVAAAHPGLVVDIENKVITRASGPTQGKVGLVSGGGSGHEPLHGGFVGFGMPGTWDVATALQAPQIVPARSHPHRSPDPLADPARHLRRRP